MYKQSVIMFLIDFILKLTYSLVFVWMSQRILYYYYYIIVNSNNCRFHCIMFIDNEYYYNHLM